jgi:hypothetical protein
MERYALAREILHCAQDDTNKGEVALKVSVVKTQDLSPTLSLDKERE